MAHALIGGIGLTVLEVYHQRPGPDGVQAGCAHVHAITDEAYFGLSGSGAIELHDPESGFRRVPIESGTFVQFPAGTLHRSVSTDHLRVLAIMGNSGLPERGDARIYFGAEVDANPERYAQAVALVKSGLEGALARRDLSAQAYVQVTRLWETDRIAYARELDRFLQVHRRSLLERSSAIADVIEAGPLRQAATAFRRLAVAAAAPPAERWAASDARVTHGMCGLLRQIEELLPS
jgi:mannose-6-phosphate isomerase-like protein (cupin superfamily)